MKRLIIGLFTVLLVITSIPLPADTQVWENEYGRLEVYPMTAQGLGLFTQYANLTWYYPDNTVDVAFRFDEPLKSGKIWYLNGEDEWTRVSMESTVYKNKQYYIYYNFNIKQGKTYHFKWSYVPEKMYGKWDLIVKLSSDTIQQSLANDRYILLDPWWNSDWYGKVKVWINHSYFDTPVKNFPVLVNTTDNVILSACQNDGDDIRFIDDSETVEYPYEIEDFSVDGMNVWVNITDTISNTTNTSFYMYYGNPMANGNESVKTWGDNYTVVFHMNDASGFLNDSTKYGNNFKESGNPTGYQNVSGAVGYSFKFDGNDDYFVNTSMDMTGWDESTLECWYDPVISHVNNQNDFLFSSRWNNNPEDIRFSFKHGATGVGDSGYQYVWDDGTAEGDSDLNYNYETGFKYYVSVIDADSFVYGYRNTSRSNPDVAVAFDFSGLDNFHNIGRRITGGQWCYGLMDEFRISNIARNWSWVNATYHTVNNISDFIEWGQPEANVQPPNSLIATTFSNSQINLTFSKNISATHTVIERNTVENWARGSGTEIYNDTGSTFSDSGITSYIRHYYRGWSYNSTVNSYSASSITANNITGPGNPSNVVTLYYGNGFMNITWNKHSWGDTVMVRQKANSYPTGVSDGSLCYNSTGSYYVHNPVNATDYFRLWSYNATVNLFSSGVNAPFGSLIIYVYNESNDSAIPNYQVFISNQNKTDTYENLSASNPCQIDISDLPHGYDTMIKINATGFDFRLYYLDLFVNQQQILYAYLPPSNDTESYYLRVINENNEPVKDAKVYIMRYINDTMGYQNISIVLTDGSGYTPAVDLIPNQDYAVKIISEGYEVEIFDMHPIPIEYGDERWFTFMISYLDTEFPENLIESEEVVLTGERSGTTVWVNFTDNTASMIGDYVIVYGTNTTNGSVYVKKLFTHNVDSWSESFTVNPYDSFIVVVYYNNSIWKKQCRTITISGIRSTFSTNTIDTFLIALVGYSPFGWGNLLLWFMLIAGCYYSDGEYAGLIILLLGGLFLTLNMVFGWESTLFTVAGGLIPSLFCLIGVLSLWSERHKGLFKGGG